MAACPTSLLRKDTAGASTSELAPCWMSGQARIQDPRTTSTIRFHFDPKSWIALQRISLLERPQVGKGLQPLDAQYKYAKLNGV